MDRATLANATLGPQAPATSRAAESRPRPGSAGGFTRAFEQALDREGIRLSRHARDRIATRHIDMNEGDVQRISDAMSELKGKGGKISILLMGETALVTDVGRRTVITALDRYSEQSKVFTQIDSAAFIDKG